MSLKKTKLHSEFISDIQDEVEKIHNIKLDKRVVDLIATHPFLFTVERVRDPEDERPIRHRYLCIIAIMRHKKKQKLQFNETTT